VAQCTLSTIGNTSFAKAGAEVPLLEVVSIGSGSCGNALLIRTTATTMMVDCGVGIRRLRGALATAELGIEDIDALLVSHEHSDHVRELPRFAALRTPVLATSGTARALPLPSDVWNEMRSGIPTRVGDAEIIAIPTSHDAADPCGFLVRTPHGAVSVFTDLGAPSGAAAEAIAESDLVVIEANHDAAMVRGGPYPVHLQRRILSDTGHLSNHDCAALLTTALRGSSRLPTVWLAHLSASNNRPQLAQRTVVNGLARAGLRLDVSPLPRRDVSEWWRPEMRRAGVAQMSLGLFD
jgi:phosphoribosyl 1,2-cyclic phosphodiesterase